MVIKVDNKLIEKFTYVAGIVPVIQAYIKEVGNELMFHVTSCINYSSLHISTKLETRKHVHFVKYVVGKVDCTMIMTYRSSMNCQVS